MNHQTSKESITTWTLLMILLEGNMLKNGDPSFGVINMLIPTKSFLKWGLLLLTKLGTIQEKDTEMISALKLY